MNLFKKNGPFIESPLSTNKMMRNLIISLLPIIIFATYKNSTTLIYVLAGGLTSFIAEAIYQIIFNKRGSKEKIISDIRNNYSFIPGLFIGLLLPYNTPIHIIIVGALFATISGKMLFGGFSNNILNPALIGIFFVTIAFGDEVAGSGLVSDSLNSLMSATPAETGTFICIASFLFLMFTRSIKVVIPTIYVGTVIILTTLLGLINGTNIEYGLVHILSGGLLFGAIFMATDPVTSPNTRMGQVLFGIGLGVITVLFRVCTSYTEGIMFSILMMNMSVYFLDCIGSKLISNNRIKMIPIVILVVVAILPFFYNTIA